MDIHIYKVLMTFGGTNMLSLGILDLGPWIKQILAHRFLKCGATPAAKAHASYKDCVYLFNRVVNFQSNKNIYAHLYVWQVSNRVVEPEQKWCIL